MRLIVGLGNPGREYERTRHNVGFRVADALAERWGIQLTGTFRHSVYGRGTARGETVCVLKPTTYMNRSGFAVTEALSWWKEGPQALLVLVDDAMLPLGSLRIRESGSAGSHNGLASIVEQLGTQEFARVRLGVGTEAVERMDLADFVLGRFPVAEEPAVVELTERAAEAVECCLAEGIGAAISRYNRRTRPPEEEDEQQRPRDSAPSN